VRTLARKNLLRVGLVFSHHGKTVASSERSSFVRFLQQVSHPTSNHRRARPALENVALNLIILRHLIQPLADFGVLLLAVAVVQLGAQYLQAFIAALELDEDDELLEMLAGRVLDRGW